MDIFSISLEFANLNVVFLVTLIEKFIPILPSYIMLPTIGMGAENGLDLMLCWLVATLGGLCGALGWYMIGSVIGADRIYQLVKRYGRFVFFKISLYEKLTSSYRQRPMFFTIVGQLIPTVRVFQALPAGVLRLPLLPFLVATAIGSQVWIIIFTTAGYYMQKAGFTIAEIGLWIFVSILIVEGAAFFAAYRFNKQKKHISGEVPLRSN